VIGDASEGGDCDEVICAGWGEPGLQWTEWGWRNEEVSWFLCSVNKLRHFPRVTLHKRPAISLSACLSALVGG